MRMRELSRTHSPGAHPQGRMCICVRGKRFEMPVFAFLLLFLLEQVFRYIFYRLYLLQCILGPPLS